MPAAHSTTPEQRATAEAPAGESKAAPEMQPAAPGEQAATEAPSGAATTSAPASGPTTPEQQQVAAAPLAPAEMPVQKIEIGPVVASTGTPSEASTAEATFGTPTVDVSSLGATAVESVGEGLSLTGEAAPSAEATIEAPTVDVRSLGATAIESVSEALSASGEAAPSAKATIGAPVDMGSLAAPAVQSVAQGLSLSGKASGTVNAYDVTIEAAEAQSNEIYVAGVAPPGTLVRLYANNEIVGSARARSEGTWLLEAHKQIPVGEVMFRVDIATGTETSQTPSVQATVPLTRYADGVVLEPVVTAVSGDGASVSETGTLPRPTYVIIRRGDCLWRIARRNYSRGIKYKAIYAANRDKILNPHWIYPGQVFVVPARDLSWETVAAD